MDPTDPDPQHCFQDSRSGRSPDDRQSSRCVTYLAKLMTFRTEDQVSLQMTVKADTTVNQEAGCPGNLHTIVYEALCLN